MKTINEAEEFGDRSEQVDKRSILELFPKPDFREHQEDVLIQTEKAFASGKRYVIIEMPPGGGKSAIATAVGRKYGGVICTPQNQLLDQYVKDDPEIKPLMGMSNYVCPVVKESSDYAPCITHNKQIELNCFLDKDGKTGSKCVQCPYVKAKQEAKNARIAAFNYHSFKAHQQDFGYNPVMILDESQCIEDFLLGICSVHLDQTKMPELNLVRDNDMGAFVSRLIPRSKGGAENHNYWDAIKWKLDKVNIDKLSCRDNPKQLKALCKEEKIIVSLMEKIKYLKHLHNKDLLKQDWILTQDPPNGVALKSISVLPVVVSGLAFPKLFCSGKRVVLMSGTVLSGEMYAKSLGIPSDQMEFISKPSTFDKKNRPIKVYPVGNMGRSTQEEDMPSVIKGIRFILGMHEKDRGIIHTHAHRMTDAVHNSIKDERLLFQEEKGVLGRRDLMYQLDKKTNGVIVAAAMHQGTDLKDDMARFQVIMKIPWPYLGDPQIRARLKRDPDWYTWITAVHVVQTYGRITRSKDDYGITYVTDTGWFKFIKDARKFLPAWFLEAVTEYRARDLYKKKITPEEDDGELNDSDFEGVGN